MVKYVETNPLSDPETTARKLMEIAKSVEAVQDGRIYIEKVNGPFLFEIKGTPDQYLAGLNYAIERGWIVKHESGSSGSRGRGRTCSHNAANAGNLRHADADALQSVRAKGSPVVPMMIGWF